MVYRKTLISFLVIAVGYVAGSMIVRPNPFEIAAILGLLSLGIFFFRIEYLYYFIVLSLILSATDAPSGSIFEYLGDHKIFLARFFFELLVAALILASCARMVFWRDKVAVSPLKFPVCIFLVLLAISVMVGLQNGVDEEFLQEDFKRFFFPVAFLICSLNILNSERRIRSLIIFSFAVAVIKSLLGMIYYLKGYGFQYGDMRTVFLASGDFLPLVTAIIVGVSLIIHKKVSGAKLLFLILGICPMLFALIFSFRRTAWLGILFSLVLLFFLVPGVRKVKMITVALSSGLIVFLLVSSAKVAGTTPSGEFLIERFYSIFDEEQDSNVAHSDEWKVTLSDIGRHPMLGLGLGSEHSIVPGYKMLNRHTVHNAFLMLWMKMGIFSLILFVYYLIRYLIFGIKAAKENEESWFGPVQVGLLSSFGFWIVSLNSAGTWFGYQETCLMGLVGSIVIYLSKRSQRIAVDGKEPLKIFSN